MRLTIGSQYHISVSACRQTTVYEGLMAGLPDAKMNQSIIESASKEASAAYPGLPVHVLEPKMPDVVAFANSSTGRSIIYACLPTYKTIAVLRSDAGGMDEKSLCVVCFSSTLGLAECHFWRERCR